MGPLPVRETQRVPRSCMECSRRKIKCTKKIPCEACVRRGDALSCAREIVRVNGTVTVAVDPDAENYGDEQQNKLINENMALRVRVQQLEELVATNEQIKQVSPHEDQENINTTFDHLHLKVASESSATHQALDDRLGSQHLLQLLPIRESSEKIVRSSLAAVGWVHCALNAPQFLIDHENFWNTLNLDNREALHDHCWLAIYMSILAVGAYFLDEEDSHEIHYIYEGFSGQYGPQMGSSLKKLLEFSRAWYDAAFNELSRADFLSRPRLSTVQTIAILMLVHRNFGEPDREYFLLGLAINIARTLGMDRLASEDTISRNLKMRPEWDSQAKRELGRRLWWTLVICDWMTIFSRPSSISPQSFTTTLSIENDTSHREIIIDLGNSGDCEVIPSPSPLAYHISMAKIARIINTHIKGARQLSTEQTYKVLQELDQMKLTFPSHLSTSESDSSQQIQDLQFPWIPVQRQELILLFEVCRINLCISQLPHFLETGSDRYNIHDCGLRAATNIAQQRRRDPSSSFAKFWGVPASTLAAGIYLALDLICFKALKSYHEIAMQLENIECCREHLQNMHGRTLVNKGPDILRRFVLLQSMWDSGQTVDGHTLQNIMNVVARSPSDSPTNDHTAMLQLSRITDRKHTLPEDPEYIGGNSSDDNLDFDLDMWPDELGIFSLATPSFAMDLNADNFEASQSLQGLNLNWN